MDIKELERMSEMHELGELFATIWGRPGEPPIDSSTLQALSHSGNYVVGAYSGKRMVGGLIGWLGGHPPDDLHLHSHILGVVPDTETRGVGFELNAIAAVVIGGTSMSGGKGSMMGTLLGASIIGVLSNGLLLLGMGDFARQMVTGLIIVVAVIIDKYRAQALMRSSFQLAPARPREGKGTGEPP